MEELVGLELKEFNGTSYYMYKSKYNTKTVLYIHGIGLSKEFFKNHFSKYELDKYSWLVPDLIGHGDSYKSKTLLTYSMKYQAEQILKLLFQESVTDLIVVSHSMGSSIAYYLITSILRLKELKKEEDFPIDVLLFISVEGNIDENDAFLSGKIASSSWREFNDIDYMASINDFKLHDPKYYETIRCCTPWDLYASSFDLIKVSRSEVTLPLLYTISTTIPIKILYGEKNKGYFSSEALLKNKFEIDYIPNSGHSMIHDNPKGFWEIVLKYISALR